MRLSSAPPPRPGDIVRIRTERWRVDRLVVHGDTSLVDVSGAERSNAGARASFVLPFEPMDRLDAVRTPRVVSPAHWRRHAQDLIARATPDPRALRAAAEAAAAILPFQLEPALAVTHGLGCRLLLADEVGLGKTVQAGLIVAELLRRQPESHALVAVPAGLREQWQHELAHRFRLPSLVLDAAALARARPGVDAAASPWTTQGVVIVSIDYVKRPEVLRAIEPMVWDIVVFDEAHGLSSHSDRSAAAARLADRARTVVLLSATPHGGDDAAFARLCGLGAAHDGYPLLAFRRTREDAGLRVARRAVWRRVTPTPAERAMHDALVAYGRRVWAEADPRLGGRLALTVLARRASSSAASLACSIERRLAALSADVEPAERQLVLPLAGADDEDDAPGAVLAAPGLRDVATERDLLRHLCHLSMLASAQESKIGTIVRLLRRTSEAIIVFTEYRDTLARLATVLATHAPAMIHGGMTRGDRAAALRRFTLGRTRLLLATDAASEGLNLHERCRCVVHLELPWTPLRLEQRVGRVERIGQQRRVHALHLVAAGTAEETVVARLVRRESRIRHALGGLKEATADPEAILRAVLGGEPPILLAPAAADYALPPDVVVPDLADLARSEAARLGQARRLRTAAIAPAVAATRTAAAADNGCDAHARSTGAWTVRPPITWIRRRSAPPRCCWIFHHEIADAEGQPIWDHLIALQATVDMGVPATAADVRTRLNPQQRPLQRALEAERHLALSAARGALAAPLALSARRERALVEAITACHARLAALVQPRLFDRQAARASAAQAAIRDEALARCAARLRSLDLAVAPRSAACEPASAVGIGR